MSERKLDKNITRIAKDTQSKLNTRADRRSKKVLNEIKNSIRRDLEANQDKKVGQINSVFMITEQGSFKSADVVFEMGKNALDDKTGKEQNDKK